MGLLMVLATGCGRREKDPVAPDLPAGEQKNEDPASGDPKFVPGEPPVEARVVFERMYTKSQRGIYQFTIPGMTNVICVTTNGAYPVWSPDGEWIAFRRSNDLWRIRPDGSGEERLLSLSSLRTYTWRPDGSEIWYADDEGIHALPVDGTPARLVTGKDSVVELDVSADGKSLVFAKKSHSFTGMDVPSGKTWRITKGCSLTFSPDATRVTKNGGLHEYLHIVDWLTGEVVGKITPPRGRRFDNQRWANHPDWIISRTEEPRKSNLWLHRISDDRRWKLTTTGDCDRPDILISRQL